MTEQCWPEEKVMARLEELALKPNLTEDEQRQLDTLIKTSKAIADRYVSESAKAGKEFDDFVKREKLRQTKVELQLKQQELANAKKDRWWTIGLEVFKAGAPLLVAVVLFGMGLSFETKGTYTSRSAQVIKNLFNLGK